MKVIKFGGSSVGSAELIARVGNYISSIKDGSIVVLSAMSGTTDSLVELSGYIYSHNIESARETIKSLESRYSRVICSLYTDEQYRRLAEEYVSGVLSFLTELTKKLFTAREEKVVLAQGELISTHLMYYYLQERGKDVRLLPALDFMRKDAHGEPDQDYIRERLSDVMSQGQAAELYITQGFICRDATDEVDNLQRGGSDYSASLIGAAMSAEEIQIWTDVDGMHNSDPRIVEGTAPVRHLSFDEAAELGYFGAKVLHPTCILPAKFAGIPVRLLDTLDPDAPGTLIDNTFEPRVIKAVAAKDNIAAITIRSSRMLLAHGFLRRVFEIFEGYQTSIDMICTSEVGVSMSIDDTRHLNEIVHDLKKYGTVSVDLDMSIICVVGDMSWDNVGFESRALDALKEIPVRMISYGGSDYNISFLVREEDKQRALRELSKNLFGPC